MRTAVLGEPSHSLRHAEDRMVLALEAIREGIRPGVIVSDVDHWVRSILTDNQVGGTLITRAGYSIGIAFPPSWDEGYILSIKPGDSTVLEEGMTFHIIPWLWGVDGDKTVGISDTVRVTENGCESFFTLDQAMVVK
jgi:Xaa-Pro dipeptidase